MHWLGCTVDLWGISKLSSLMALLVYIPINCVLESSIFGLLDGHLYNWNDVESEPR